MCVRAGIRCPLLKTPKLPRNQTWVNVNIVIINFLYFYLFFIWFYLVLFGFISIVGNVGGMGGQWQFVPFFIFYYFFIIIIIINIYIYIFFLRNPLIQAYYITPCLPYM